MGLSHINCSLKVFYLEPQICLKPQWACFQCFNPVFLFDFLRCFMSRGRVHDELVPAPAGPSSSAPETGRGGGAGEVD